MASSTLIQPNVNVDVKGYPMKIPSASEIADGTYDWACAILEVVAARLHQESGRDTSSTTTVGLIADICCLYLTSQNNDKFAGIEAKQIKEWIDEISKVDYAAFLNALKLGAVYELSEKDVKDLRRIKRPGKEVKALINNINFVYYNLYPSFLRLMRIKKELPEAFTYVKNLINKVEVINNVDLVPSGSMTTGLHGEGRFVRYCYIKYVTDLSLLKELGSKFETDIVEPKMYFGEKLQPKDFMLQLGSTAERYHLCMAKLRKDTQIRVMKIFVASSQGTCKGCQEMLTELSIAHNRHRYSHEAASPNWIDPFTWRDTKSDSTPLAHMSATVLVKKTAEFLAEDILMQEKLKEEEMKLKKQKTEKK